MVRFLDFDYHSIQQTAIDSDSFQDYLGFNGEEFPSYTGKEHYKLLAYLGNQFNNGIIIDIGTHMGYSALALSQNKSNIVHSFDIMDKIDPRFKNISNIQFHISDLWNDDIRAQWFDTLMSSQIIFLDIDPHEGVMEYELYCFLRDNNYQGIVIADDIWYFKDMRDNFWYQIPSCHKQDITKYGHWSGTGIIKFGEKNTYISQNTLTVQDPVIQDDLTVKKSVIQDDLTVQKSVIQDDTLAQNDTAVDIVRDDKILTSKMRRKTKSSSRKRVSETSSVCQKIETNFPKREPTEKSWTFVTAYFDLTKYPDASAEIKSRPQSFYLKSANTTMALDCNLIVYCDDVSYDSLYKLRPDFLQSKTKYIVCDFEDFPLNTYRNQIDQNRVKNPSSDPRNTVSYYLFCMARYAMVKQTIDSNPFDSTHFGWINICIERYGYKNVMALTDVMEIYRDKFSTCYIDYISENMITNLPEYYQRGRCSLCSGFFTGNSKYFKEFCNLIEEQFVQYVNLGYGHADEQLYSPIYFKRPEIFEVYFGDYNSMVTNYVRVVDDSDKVIQYLIANSLLDKQYQVCYQACLAIWKYCTELLPNKDRRYDSERNTSILGSNRLNYLKALLVSSRGVNDYDMACKALVELACIQFGL